MVNSRKGSAGRVIVVLLAGGIPPANESWRHQKGAYCLHYMALPRHPARLFREWSDAIALDLEAEKGQLLANLALVITFLCQNGHKGAQVREDDLSYAYALIYGTHTKAARLQYITTQNGFIAVPLCTLLNGEQIEELF